jgi:DNA-binding transcriptional ArsR family regulator
MQPDIFEILADPSRRRIVELLRVGEQTVNDVVAASSLHQSGISRHLRILHEAGFVTVRPDGAHRYYALRAEPFRELDGWLSGYRGLWEARLDRLGAALAQKQKARAASRDGNPREAKNTRVARDTKAKERAR